jgi:hypothetical protein
MVLAIVVVMIIVPIISIIVHFIIIMIGSADQRKLYERWLCRGGIGGEAKERCRRVDDRSDQCADGGFVILSGWIGASGDRKNQS